MQAKKRASDIISQPDADNAALGSKLSLTVCAFRLASEDKARGIARTVLCAMIALIAATLAMPVMAAGECVIAPADREWLATSLDQWTISARDELKLEDAALPTIYAIDGSCLHTLSSGDMRSMQSEAHGGTVDLPEGPTIPVAPTSFAFGRSQFVMSLPSVWREAGVKSDLGLEALMTGVLLHEIMHTLQSELITDEIEPIAARQGLAELLSDDLLQERFEGRADYVAAYREERDALFAAASEPNDGVALSLAAHALHLMRERQERWLSGDNSHFADFDNVFLTMEGAGQWLMYRYFLTLEDGALDPAKALAETRRGGRWWSQDEGLALILVVDRFLPDWQERIFSHPDWYAERLLASAVER